MTGEAELGGFLEAAGVSLEEAQRGLGGAAVPTTVAIAEVELEVKATIEPTEGEGLSLRPVSSEEAQEIDPEALSTVRVRYVPVADEGPVPTPAGGEEPRRSAEEVIAEVRGHRDVAALARALGELSFHAGFVPSMRRWLVVVSDDQDHTVREVVVPD